MSEDRFKDFAERARKRAAETVDTWYPENEGDNNGGRIESIQFIDFQYGRAPSTVFVTEDGTKVRYNWMGALPLSAWDRYKPVIGDFMWVHHHGTKPQKDDMNDYNNIQVVVFDQHTGEEKVPADDYTPPANVNADGEIINPQYEEKPFDESNEKL